MSEKSDDLARIVGLLPCSELVYEPGQAKRTPLVVVLPELPSEPDADIFIAGVEPQVKELDFFFPSDDEEAEEEEREGEKASTPGNQFLFQQSSEEEDSEDVVEEPSSTATQAEGTGPEIVHSQLTYFREMENVFLKMVRIHDQYSEEVSFTFQRNKQSESFELRFQQAHLLSTIKKAFALRHTVTMKRKETDFPFEAGIIAYNYFTTAFNAFSHEFVPGSSKYGPLLARQYVTVERERKLKNQLNVRVVLPLVAVRNKSLSLLHPKYQLVFESYRGDIRSHPEFARFEKALVVPSIKNVLVVGPEDEVLFRLTKTSSYQFELGFRSPLTIYSAFCLAVCICQSSSS